MTSSRRPASASQAPSERRDDLAPILRYLDEIGYRDLYLPAARAAAEPRAAERRSAEAGNPERADSAAPQPHPPTASTPAGAPASGGAAAGRPHRSSEAPRLDPHDGLFGIPPSGWEQYRSLEELSRFCADCTRCGLAAGRQNVVFGSGDPDADLMFIGEGPGAEEDRQGLPFVGPAGELLGKILGAIGLSREQVYIANIVKCRPPGNRDPLPDEVKACRGYLERQIDLVRPRVIVALGRVAAQTLLESELPLGRLRGRWHSVRGVAVRATYHPAALLRNASWKRPTWEDMKVVRAHLDDA